MMKIIGYIMVVLGFIGVFVFVVVASDQVHFYFNAVDQLPQSQMIERETAVTQMANIDRSWRRLCHSAQWPSFMMLVGAILIGIGGRKKKPQPVSPCDSSPRADTGLGPQEK